MMDEFTYKCKECGGIMTVSLIATYPPITCYRCPDCGRHIDDQPKINRRTIVK